LAAAAFDKVFGSNAINIVPQGSAELIFGLNISHTENPTLSEKLKTIPTFDFKEKIQMNVTGTIGDKVQLGVNYNTDAMFDFENRTKSCSMPARKMRFLKRLRQVMLPFLLREP